MTATRATATPVRSCIGCGARDAQSAMLRLRVDPRGEVQADASLRSGRSAYVHATRACIDGIARSRGIARSLRRPVTKEERARLAEALGREIVVTGAGA